MPQNQHACFNGDGRGMSLDAWLYAFWHRRYQEGSASQVASYLSQIDHDLNPHREDYAVYQNDAPATQGPSYDCELPQLTEVESLICDSEVLATYDQILSTLYQRIVGEASARPLLGFSRAEGLPAAQARWLRARNGCDDAACLKAAYRARLAELASISDELAYLRSPERIEALLQKIGLEHFEQGDYDWSDAVVLYQKTQERVETAKGEGDERQVGLSRQVRFAVEVLGQGLWQAGPARSGYCGASVDVVIAYIVLDEEDDVVDARYIAGNDCYSDPGGAPVVLEKGGAPSWWGLTRGAISARPFASSTPTATTSREWNAWAILPIAAIARVTEPRAQRPDADGRGGRPATGRFAFLRRPGSRSALQPGRWPIVAGAARWAGVCHGGRREDGVRRRYVCPAG
ncbi:hypothetical protein CAL65_20960 [Alkalilimnicola ehrlichii]|uniref:Lysozyme inhibitor LprI N-terminal domain-containing protein n=1 Tax=Alkalilimnicola ehrlichii TaxID=351052 RepID=A0A3E0WI79_9GAMM|nr:hypothetical protein CAL65_20960 [Alkalilimnicola ehrlichii]